MDRASTPYDVRDGLTLVPEPGRSHAFTLRVGGADQSHVDLADPTRLVFEYVQRIADTLDLLRPPPDRIGVVHVGGAGLTLPRYVAVTRPRSAQVVLEPDADLTAYVRDHLPLPSRSGIKVRPVDGRTGLAGLRDAYADVVVVDAFEGPVVPPDLTTAEAFGEVARVLRPDGVLLANIADRGPFAYARRVLAAARTAFAETVVTAEPATLKGRRFGNVLLVASRAPLPVQAMSRRAASSVFPYRVLAGPDLDSVLGGGARFTDADAEASPAPPGGATFFA
ncbi:spermidine synthase [Mumia zhuanghuii]|uniref:Spermidine synthase n=1 Tax=Mumia zhuanghuii TaxID=2585211 RepID=A0A5C4MIQ1_9ACTN|nr:fused MFS/spermidine synthase [Mumia zhuanghuii]TNC26609.1 spermidine synthase [Mumia zhuanghuii]TNC40356.1 spermidine synthase [Mumia zhuanghuii]